MKARILVLVFGLIGGSAALLLGFHLFKQFRKADFSQEALDRIKIGMTLKEVESIIGMPPGNYCSQAWEREHFKQDHEFFREKGVAFWTSDTVLIMVNLSPEEVVESFYIRPLQPPVAPLKGPHP